MSCDNTLQGRERQQMGRQAGRQTDRQAHRQTGSQTDMQAGTQTVTKFFTDSVLAICSLTRKTCL